MADQDYQREIAHKIVDLEGDEEGPMSAADLLDNMASLGVQFERGTAASAAYHAEIASMTG